MNENELKPIFQNLLDSLPNYVREQVELCLYHNDPYYSSTIVETDASADMILTKEIMENVISAIAKVILEDKSSVGESHIEKIGDSYVSYDCKC